MDTLQFLRGRRTRASTRVREIIRHNITGDAPYLSPDGLPSWWPFWSDVLVENVRTCVRAARLVEEAERGNQ